MNFNRLNGFIDKNGTTSRLIGGNNNFVINFKLHNWVVRGQPVC